MADFRTAQETFWAGDFGTQYIDRNRDPAFLAQANHRWAYVLRNLDPIKSVLEMGANIGLNLRAMRVLLPSARLQAVEINPVAHRELSELGFVEAHLASLLEFAPAATVDLSFTSGVLIHIAPEQLPVAYRRLYEASHRYIALLEWFSPVPVEVPYRGHAGRAFKRDFAGEMLDMFPDLRLVDYGFFYRRDHNFSADDLNWFVLEKRDRR